MVPLILLFNDNNKNHENSRYDEHRLSILDLSKWHSTNENSRYDEHRLSILDLSQCKI